MIFKSSGNNNRTKMNHHIMSKRKKPKPLSKMLFLSVLLLFRSGLTSDEVKRRKVPGVRFSHLTQYPGSPHPSFAALGVTRGGEAYAIPYDFAKATPLTFKDSEGEPWGGKVINVLYLSAERLFVTYEDTQTGKHCYQLFIPSKTLLTEMTAESKPSSAGDLQDQSVKQGSLTKLSYRDGRVNLELLAIFGQSVEIIRYDKTSNSIQTFSSEKLIQNPNLRHINGALFKEGARVVYLASIAQQSQSPHKNQLVVYKITKAMSTDSAPESELISESQEHFSERRSLITKIWPQGDDSSSFAPDYNYFAYSTGTHIVLSGIQASKLVKKNSRSFASEATSIDALTSIPSSTFAVMLYQKGSTDYSQGKEWNRSTNSAVIYIFEARRKTPLNSELVFGTVIETSVTDYPLGTDLVIDSHSKAIIAADWDSEDNLIYLGNPFTFGCPPGHMKMLESGKVECRDLSLSKIAQYCSVVLDGVSKSCQSCLPDTDKETFNLVDASDWRHVFRRVCLKRESQSPCNDLQQYSSEEDKCYSCSEIKGCIECFDNIKRCRACKSGFRLDESNYAGCLKCAESDESPNTSQPQNWIENDFSTVCEPEKYLSHSHKTNQGISNPCGLGCNICQAIRCSSCDPGYNLVDAFCRTDCKP